MTTLEMVLLGLVLFFVVLGVLFLLSDLFLGFQLYPAALEVYGILSTEYRTINWIRRRIHDRQTTHYTRLANSFLLFSITRIKHGVTRETWHEFLVLVCIGVLIQRKMAEILELPFVDGADIQRHPILLDLTSEDIEEYTQIQNSAIDFYNAIKKEIEQTGDREFAEDVSKLYVYELPSDHQVNILCVRKLPVTRTPKRYTRQLGRSLADAFTGAT